MMLVGLICLVLVMGGADSKIVISSPLVTPFPDNKIPYLYSNIGHLDYDKSQSYDLVISNASLCNSSSLPPNRLFSSGSGVVLSGVQCYKPGSRSGTGRS